MRQEHRAGEKCFVDGAGQKMPIIAPRTDEVTEVSISTSDLEKLAHGRVWTGRQAEAGGLVDQLGGLHRAIEVAKELAGIPVDETVTVEHFPESRSALEVLLGGDEAATGRWLFYKALRRDARTTMSILTSGLAGGGVNQ